MNGNPRPRFTYLGHATVLGELPDGRAFVIDPWLRENPKCPEELKNPERVDAILISHGHQDHMADAAPLAEKHNPEKIVASFEICQWLKRQGTQNTFGMNLGGSQEVLGMRVSMVRADHSSSIVDGDSLQHGGPAAGYMVRLPEGYTFYFAGDTGLFLDMQLLGDIFHPELAFLPIGDHYTMDPHLAARACRVLGVRKVVPIHWGTFPELTGTPDQLRRELADLGVDCEMIAMQPGDVY